MLVHYSDILPSCTSSFNIAKIINFRKKAKRLNKLNKPYKVKFDYNKDFFIDFKRTSPVSESRERKNADLYLKDIRQ